MNIEPGLIKSNDEFEKLEPAWNDLLSQSPANNYFLTWDWLWNWWRIYAREDDELSILLWKKDDRVAGIAPLYVRKRRLGGMITVRRMMFLGTQEDSEGDVCSDYMDIIYRVGEEQAVIKSFFDFMTANDLCDEIFISRIDIASKTFPVFRKEAKRLGFLILTDNEFVSPYITLPRSWDQYLTGLSGSMRWNIKNERRKQLMKNNISFRKTENSDNLAKDFDTLVALHQNLWTAKGMPGAFSNDKFVRFHKDVMQTMIAKGNLDLVLLYEGDRCRAADYNIFYKNKMYFYQTGREISNEKIAYGNLIHYHCIEQAINDGLAEYDFLPKGRLDDYKDRFTKEHRTVCDLYIVCNRTIKQFIRAKESTHSFYNRVKSIIGHSGTTKE